MRSSSGCCRRCPHGTRCAGRAPARTGARARRRRTRQRLQARTGCRGGRTRGTRALRRDRVRHTHALRRHGCTDAQLSRPHRRPVGARRARRKDRQRLRRHLHPARRQETTITSFHTTLLHHGMVIVGLPYSFGGLPHMDEISGGTPYGATAPAGSDGRRAVSANEIVGARFQGAHGAAIAQALVRGRAAAIARRGIEHDAARALAADAAAAGRRCAVRGISPRPASRPLPISGSAGRSDASVRRPPPSA
jgi:hypothetical protein